MKPIEEIIKNNPNCRLWSDKTIDIEFSENDLYNILNAFLCLSCDKKAASDKDLSKITSSDHGISIKCECGQKWFVHKKLNVPDVLLDEK